MTILSIEKLREIHQEQRGPLICLDMGQKKIGIASSDRHNLMAFPKNIYVRKNFKKDVEYIISLKQNAYATALILGLPPIENTWKQEIKNFGKHLSSKHEIPVYYQNEELSTMESKLLLEELPIKKNMKMNDHMAAYCILNRTILALNNS